MLQAERNMYDGMIINTSALPAEDDRFFHELRRSLDQWREERAALAWLTLPAERNALFPALMDMGFLMHHCDQREMTLVLRLRDRAFIPSYATHYIGAGGVVINARNQLLVITEKAHKTKHFKLPGGLLDPGEDLVHAVEREVREETGIKARFDSLVCLRHTHGYQFGKSDFYFVCRLSPLTEEITPDPREIAYCQWMDLEEYLTSEGTHIFNRTIVEAALSGQRLVLSDKLDYSFRLKELEVFLPPETEERVSSR